MVKNCDLGLENAILLKVFSRPRSQFFTIRTSQPANNIYLSYHTFDISLTLVTFVNFYLGRVNNVGVNRYILCKTILEERKFTLIACFLVLSVSLLFYHYRPSY